MGQLLLLPDARPLDERLGRSFFREAPRRPCVYLMKDSAGRVLYVGKAKNLKQRLNNYRVANPDRMPPRHLRMVREVSRIEFQFCPNESAALAQEARLLRGLKPKFNRAGVWQGPPRFLLWRTSKPLLEMTVAETPETGWRRFGPLGGGASHLHRALARLIWLAAKPDCAFTEMPVGQKAGLTILDLNGKPLTTKLDIDKIFAAFRGDAQHPQRTAFVAAKDPALAEQVLRLPKRK